MKRDHLQLFLAPKSAPSSIITCSDAPRHCFGVDFTSTPHSFLSLTKTKEIDPPVDVPSTSQ